MSNPLGESRCMRVKQFRCLTPVRTKRTIRPIGNRSWHPIPVGHFKSQAGIAARCLTSSCLPRDSENGGHHGQARIRLWQRASHGPLTHLATRFFPASAYEDSSGNRRTRDDLRARCAKFSARSSWERRTNAHPRRSHAFWSTRSPLPAVAVSR